MRRKRFGAPTFRKKRSPWARETHGLLSMELELSRKCNMRCIYCYASAGEKLDDELTFSEIEDVLQQAIALGAKRIIILGGGEPLLYPEVMEIMRILHAQGIGMDLFTNGTLITRSMAEAFMEMGVHPVVKMNSRREEVQDFLADMPGTFRRIQQGMAHLAAAGYPRPTAQLAYRRSSAGRTFRNCRRCGSGLEKTE
jgi:MoaA/NifB/PqqE/SkfB family radical SAM enzyme